MGVSSWIYRSHYTRINTTYHRRHGRDYSSPFPPPPSINKLLLTSPMVGGEDEDIKEEEEEIAKKVVR